MATKKKSPSKAAAENLETDRETTKRFAQLALLPSTNAAAVIGEYGNIFGDHDLSDIVAELRESIDSINDGNMKRCEGMLITQAHALQSIFTNLSRRALNQEYMKNLEAFLRLALKAQSQCRQTLETLSTLKNPPVVYAKQANISTGPQQVNNGTPAPATHAEKFNNQPNELLEVINGERVDTGTTQEAIRGDTAMAAVE
jgi:hypothetical protein